MVSRIFRAPRSINSILVSIVAAGIFALFALQPLGANDEITGIDQNNITKGDIQRFNWTIDIPPGPPHPPGAFFMDMAGPRDYHAFWVGADGTGALPIGTVEANASFSL